MIPVSFFMSLRRTIVCYLPSGSILKVEFVPQSIADKYELHCYVSTFNSWTHDRTSSHHFYRRISRDEFHESNTVVNVLDVLAIRVTRFVQDRYCFSSFNALDLLAFQD